MSQQLDHRLLYSLRDYFHTTSTQYHKIYDDANSTLKYHTFRMNHNNRDQIWFDLNSQFLMFLSFYSINRFELVVVLVDLVFLTRQDLYHRLHNLDRNNTKLFLNWARQFRLMVIDRMTWHNSICNVYESIV
jgi:hypothetical protein